MTRNDKRYRTQWAAQFFVAGELTRRGYLISLTLGNAPDVDLFAVSGSGNKFMIDVKGLSSKNFWLIKESEVRDDLYYVLVYIPAQDQQPEYYIFSSSELMNAIKSLKERTLSAGKKWVESGSGINWGTALTNKSCWNILPA
jgi:hypothetical protein